MAMTLVINPENATKRYTLYKDGRIIFGMRFERNADHFGVCRIKKDGDNGCTTVAGGVYRYSLKAMLDELIHDGIITNLKDIERVGIRVTAPGTHFQSHRVVDREFMRQLRKKELSAPLHVPATLNELESVERELPFSAVIGVSDSAFHTTLPACARTYSINTEDAKRFDIYRYGYHGLSVGSVTRRADTLFGVCPARLLVFHLSDGVSVTALRNGVSVDTTMGFAPLSGAVMGTRAGDIEAGALLELIRARKFTHHDAEMYINTEGGLQGMAGTGDLRTVLNNQSTDQAARDALQLYFYHLKKAVGALTAVLGGVDAIILTASAAERNADFRSQLMREVGGLLQVAIDEQKNEQLIGVEGLISTAQSPVKVAVMKTDETGEVMRVVEEIYSSNN